MLQLGTAFTAASDGQLATVEVVTLTATALSLNLSNQTEGFTLNGFATGASTITGGAGADSFVFNTALGITNIDTIVDFSVVDDTIRLENNGIFTALTTTGTLAAASFVGNSTGVAVDGNDYIVHNTSTGALLYDADGSGVGAAVQFSDSYS